MKWELLSPRRTVCVSDTVNFLKYQFAMCFISGGLFKLAHAHQAEINQKLQWRHYCTQISSSFALSGRTIPVLASAPTLGLMKWTCMCGCSSPLWALWATRGWMPLQWRWSMTVDFSTPPLMGGVAGRKYLPSTSAELAIKDQHHHRRQEFRNVSVGQVNKYTAR